MSYIYRMQEDYLHYLWEFQKWKGRELMTSEGLPISVIFPGTHNFLSSPDFFNGRLVIGDQEWAGNVEIHIKSSDWYAHRHEKDPAYDNVILHVVWEHDLDIFRKDNSPLPVLELKELVSEKALQGYENLTAASSGKWINCEKDFASIDDFTMGNWLERLYFERLETKSQFLAEVLEKSSGDWEELLFKMLAKNFGLNINGEAFLSIANSIPFKVVRKLRANQEDLEAVFMGQAGLLEKDLEEPYYQNLKERYCFLKKKYGLKVEGVLPVKYFRLRPDNFPEIRLAQLAALYHHQPSLFSQLISSKKTEGLEQLFSCSVNNFWETHYTFSKPHSRRKKRLTPQFVELLIINTLVPVKFYYLKEQGKEGFEPLYEVMASLDKESNQTVGKYNLLRPSTASNALESQALLQLKKEYCDKKHCLQCSVGTKILQRQEQI